jgi:ferric-dicitrate binding protein FerR (iron transport regulator)
MAALLAVAASSGADQKMPGRATASCQPVVSQVVSIQGQACVLRQDQDHWQPVRLNDLFCTGDRLRVAERSRAAIVLDNGAVLRIDQNTTIVFNGIEAESTFLIELLRGAAYFFSRKARSLKLTTPFVNGVVRGTEFFARVDDEKIFITLFEGSLQTDNARGGLLLASGQSAVVPAGQAPRPVIVAQPRDAVQWRYRKR